MLLYSQTPNDTLIDMLFGFVVRLGEICRCTNTFKIQTKEAKPMWKNKVIFIVYAVRPLLCVYHKHQCAHYFNGLAEQNECCEAMHVYIWIQNNSNKCLLSRNSCAIIEFCHFSFKNNWSWCVTFTKICLMPNRIKFDSVC